MSRTSPRSGTLEIGADLVDGAPYRDPDPLGCQRQLLDIAADFDVPVDLHTDQTLDEHVFTLASVPVHRAEAGLERAKVASHCVSLGVQPLGYSPQPPSPPDVLIPGGSTRYVHQDPT